MPHSKLIAKNLLAFSAAFLASISIARAGDPGSIDLDALRLLAPASALGVAPQDKTGALSANLKVTEQVQNGSAGQPLLQSFKDQQQQALRDAAITSDNARQLADGLGSELGGIYQSAVNYTNGDKGALPHGSNISPSLATLFRLANDHEKTAAGTAKFFFADGKASEKTCALQQVHDLLDAIHGKVDVFGTAYSHDASDAKPCADNQLGPVDTDANACTKSSDKFGNSRAVPDRAGAGELRRHGLFRRPQQQSILSLRAAAGSAKKSQLSERPHGLRLYRVRAARHPRAGALSADDRACGGNMATTASSSALIMRWM